MNHEVIQLEGIEIPENQPMIGNNGGNRIEWIEHRKALLPALLQNNEDTIEFILENFPIDSDKDLRYYKYKYEINGNQFNSILVIACVDETVEAKTLGTLFTAMAIKYGDIEYIDRDWFGWEPIHYVARTANPEKLKTLIEVEGVNIDSLTYFSENALHILLQYEKSAISFGALLNKNEESKFATILGTEKNAILACAKILIYEETLWALFKKDYGRKVQNMDAKIMTFTLREWSALQNRQKQRWQSAGDFKLAGFMDLKLKMAGNTNSKEVREEIVIAQAGNSGGQTNSPQQNGSISSRDILEIGVVIVAVAVIILYIYRIDVNQSNIWNETPICLAVRYRYTNLIDSLLSIDNIDIDSFKESEKTIREYLKWNLYVTVPKSYIQEDPVTIRFNYLKSGDQDLFLRYYPDNLVDHVNSKAPCTMLQLCLIKGFLAYLQDEGYKQRRLINDDIKDSPMLWIFKTKGLGRCIVHLLSNGADISKTTEKFKEPVLDYSAVRGYYPFVAILLHHKNSSVKINDIFRVLSKLYENKLVLNHGKFYINCVLYLLLNKLVYLIRHSQQKKVNSNMENSVNGEQYTSTERQTILNKLLYTLNLEQDERNLDNSEIIYQILHAGASLLYMPNIDERTNMVQDAEDQDNRETFNKFVIQRLDQSLLRNHFDSCIHGTTFKYDSIIQDNEENYNENRTFHFLVSDSNKQQLLTHPLIIQLIREKWSKIYWVFYADLLFYTFLLASIYGFIITQHFGFYIQTLDVLYIIFIAFHVFKESVQFLFLYRWKYFLEMSNILESITIICCLLVRFLPTIYVSVASILFSTFIFFLLLGQLPFFTKYTIIFNSIKYFFQYMAFYSIQFVAFSICFYLVFPFQNRDSSNDNKNPDGTFNISSNQSFYWGDMSKSLFYTLIYFTGEFSERVLEPVDYPVFGRVLMTVFIFCMTIILNNLLVGLIVADMDDIQKTGTLYKQVKIASFIQNTNTFIKRIHAFKSFKSIKNIIEHTDVFKEGEEKVFHNVNIHKFDDNNKKYLKDIQKVQIFDRHMLRNIYNEVLDPK